jgi:hypothetical protein
MGLLLRMCRGPPGRGGASAVDRFPEDGAPHPTTSTKERCDLLKKVLTWLAVAFVVFYIIQRPEDAAGIVRSAGAALGDAATSLSAFVGSLV